MAKHSSHILELARRGAHHRYQELKAELDSLIHHFPDLARGVVKKGRKAIKSAEGEIAQAMERSRVRRKMSAAARKAVSQRMKKYWAARRKTKKA
jgi:hypothetical protein